MTAVLRATGLGKRYGRRWALTDCTLEVPPGRVVGLVGPNGAGKTTLLQLAVGLLRPTTGTIEVLGGRPGSGRAQLAKVGFVAQDAPVQPGLSIRDHLTMGARLNPGRWDAAMARERVEALDLDPAQKAGRLSGGQRAQLALTLAVAKRPDLLLLDEPVASLDPLARREFMQALMEFTAEHGVGVVFSSHLVADLERVCDHLILLAAARVLVAGEIEELTGSHRRLIGPRRLTDAEPDGARIVHAAETDRQSTLVVRRTGAIDETAWTAEPIGLEDLTLAYMAGARTTTRRHLEGARS